MRASQKKIVSVILICAFLICMAIVQGTVKPVKKEEPAPEGREMSAEGTKETAEYANAKTDLVFWYEDDTYTEFFETAAQRYFSKTGVKVSVECQNTIDYIGSIYDKTMQDDGFPDVYLLPGDNLEEAYLYGLVSVNKNAEKYAGILSNALEAASYGEKVLGYPLSYNACLFVYQNGYFEEAPTSLQMIIDYSDQNEPAENVEYLLEWDVNDAFYDFPFISNSVSFDKTQAEVMKVNYNEEMYAKDMAFFEEILESFSVDASKVSESGIIENFLAGRTLCAILDTNSLQKLEGYAYSMQPIPNLNEELPAATCAVTDMLAVNDFSEQGEQAAAFAKFVTVDMASELHALTGHYSVLPSENPDKAETMAAQIYESAVLMPDSQDAKDFWVNLEETISKYF